MMKLTLIYVGRDRWERPVYKCGEVLLVDVDPRKDHPPDLCTKNGNEFEGEPLSSIAKEVEIEFVPQRDTW